ncbi:MAG: DUF4920 domain-containing protein [Chitinophagales bacterium]|nr:DUF4920 domain-containing protein [Chitinophagales bacterium]MDW8419308.1 DUF4920 domain-containing protein [Chitinophagales bacterium]
MKHIAWLLLIVFTTHIVNAQSGVTCDPKKEQKKERKFNKNKSGSKAAYFGARITPDGAIDVQQLPERMKDSDKLNVKITGTVTAVCQVKGCWMTTDLGNGQSMRIRFKDYAFFVPKDASGRKFIAQGTASWVTTSVEQLRHYAEDAGKSPEEISKITQPKKELVFLAEGVILQ